MNYIENDSYEEYKDNQIRTNKGKLQYVWITDNEIVKLVKYIKKNNITIHKGVCHGARNGYEVSNFRELLDADIIGTDISDTATQFPNMVQWDMHDRNIEWVDYFDFIYSNSIDHSYDFNLCLSSWMESLTKDGICCIQWSGEISNPFNKTDCFGIEKQELINLINEQYAVTDIIEVAGRGPGTIVLIIQHKK